MTTRREILEELESVGVVRLWPPARELDQHGPCYGCRKSPVPIWRVVCGLDKEAYHGACCLPRGYLRREDEQPAQAQPNTCAAESSEPPPAQADIARLADECCSCEGEHDEDGLCGCDDCKPSCSASLLVAAVWRAVEQPARAPHARNSSGSEAVDAMVRRIAGLDERDDLREQLRASREAHGKTSRRFAEFLRHNIELQKADTESMEKLLAEEMPF